MHVSVNCTEQHKIMDEERQLAAMRDEQRSNEIKKLVDGIADALIGSQALLSQAFPPRPPPTSITRLPPPTTLCPSSHVRIVPCTHRPMYACPMYPSSHVPLVPCTHRPMYASSHVRIVPCTHRPMYPSSHVPIVPCTHRPMYPSSPVPIVLPLRSQTSFLAAKIILGRRP